MRFPGPSARTHCRGVDVYMVVRSTPQLRGCIPRFRPRCSPSLNGSKLSVLLNSLFWCLLESSGPQGGRACGPCGLQPFNMELFYFLLSAYCGAVQRGGLCVFWLDELNSYWTSSFGRQPSYLCPALLFESYLICRSLHSCFYQWRLYCFYATHLNQASPNGLQLLSQSSGNQLLSFPCRKMGTTFMLFLTHFALFYWITLGRQWEEYPLFTGAKPT